MSGNMTHKHLKLKCGPLWIYFLWSLLNALVAPKLCGKHLVVNHCEQETLIASSK